MSKEQMRPSSKQAAPDPSNNYERSHPENESGMGRLDNNKFTPAARPDSISASVTNKQDATHQLNSEDVINQRSGPGATTAPAAKQPDHSMKDEEPMGWDTAPIEAMGDSARHPRTGGKGGTPDVGEARNKS